MEILRKILYMFIFVAALAGVVFLINFRAKSSNQKIDELIKKMMIFDQQIAALNNQLSIVEKKADEKSIVKEEIVRREIIREKSQEELLTSAVAKITPAVVSIVVSKDVPQLEIVYENPFGNDPFFKDFGFKVPVYRQKGTERKNVGAGTGFLIRPEGYILTNRHVVEDASAQFTVLLSNGAQKAAEMVYRDPNNDIAILKITGSGYTSVSLGNSNDLKLGQAAFAVGNALGQYSNSVSVGIISGLNRNIEAASKSGLVETLTGVIQTDAAINPGNSGGPLVDLNGKVIGVNVATVVGSSNISFSIPINTVKSIINSVLK